MLAVLLISDCHVGRVTKSFDVQVFMKRLNTLKSNVATLLNEVYDVDRLAIFMLGDIVDGEEVYKGHGYDKETVLIEEIDIALGAISTAITFWEHIVDIEGVYCVKGNHGRMRSGSAKTNWDSVLYRLLAERYSKHNVSYTDDWYMVVELEGHKYMLTHGDSVRMYHQVPFYGIQRNVLRWQSGVVGQFDVLCMGHFHTFARFCVNSCEVIMNGTMLSGDEYCERMGLQPVNKFVMFGVDKKRPITWMEVIDLNNEL